MRAAASSAVRAGRWNIAQREPIRRISQLSLGLVGYGKIARELHRKMLAFGVGPVYVADPYRADDDVASARADALIVNTARGTLIDEAAAARDSMSSGRSRCRRIHRSGMRQISS
jgi:phosphoglycerate dehydrogenase-like enzyme